MAGNIAAPFLHTPAIRRLLFTAGALLVYRLGCQIPLPGLDTHTLARLNGVLAVDRVSIFALGVTPFLSALIVLELIKLLIPPFGRWETRQPDNARRLGLFAYFAGLVMAGFQARGVANALGGIAGLFKEPGWETVVAITLVAGTALLGWLAERITTLGLGNGFWLLVIAPTLVNLPTAATGSIELVQRGSVTPEMLAVAIAFLAIGTALVVTATQAAMTSPEYRMSGAAFVGVWPPLLANYISPFAVVSFGLTPGGAAHLAVIAVLIAVFNWLQARGAAPGTSRPARVIALIQIVVCVSAEWLIFHTTLPFTVNGSWLIVVVTAALSCLPREQRLKTTPPTPA